MILVESIEVGEILTNNVLLEANLKLINCKRYESIAKDIDKENYSSDRFKMGFIYDKNGRKIDADFQGIFYMDYNKQRHFLEKSILNMNRFDLSNILQSVALEFGKILKENQ